MNYSPKIFRFFIYTLPLFLSVTFAQQWQHLGLNGEVIGTIAIDKTNPNVIYAGSTSDFTLGKIGGVFKTTNGGISWDTLVRGITVTDIDFHPTNSNIVFVTGGTNGLTSSKILKTTDSGKTWFRSDSGIVIGSETGPYCLEFDNSRPETLFVGTVGIDGGALYKSTSHGLYWKKINGPVEFGNGITAIEIDPKNINNIFVGTNGNVCLYYSTNGGETWTNKGTNNEIINTIKYKNSERIFLGTSALFGHLAGLFFSDDTFNTWNYFNPGFTTTTHIRRIVIAGDTTYLRGSERLYRLIKDSILENISTNGERCNEIGVNGNNLYIGTENGIMRKDIITNISKSKLLISETSTICQNYPNPFNSNTIIKFTLANQGYAKAEIYNVLGENIITVFDQFTLAGQYSISLDKTMFSSNSASGVFYFRLIQNGRVVATVKLLLIK